MERLDQLTQALIDYLIQTRYGNEREYCFRHKISKDEWFKIQSRMIEKDLMTQTFGLEIGNFSITPYTIKYHGDHYLKQAEKERIEKEEEHQRLQKVAEKLDTDLTLAKWQKKAFWWVFFLGGVGGTCGIISLCIKIAEYLNSH